jgi:hypothetical protein
MTRVQQLQQLERLRASTAVLSALGWLVAVAGFTVAGASFVDGWLRDGGAAYDFHSYYLAGQRILAGVPIYTPVEINDPGAYRYLPTFAVAMAPLTVIPELALTWLYRAACILALRYLVGSWRAVGWALLFPPVLIELWSLNLTLPLAAGARWALKGSGAAGVPAQALLKYSSVLLIPYLWATRSGSRRPVLVGAVAAAAIIGIHAALDPAAWGAFLASLAQQSASANAAPYVGDQLLFLVPSTLADFLLRSAIAIALVIVAVRRRLDWLAFVAVVVAVPTLWLARLAPLVAVPRLMVEDRLRSSDQLRRSP